MAITCSIQFFVMVGISACFVNGINVNPIDQDLEEDRPDTDAAVDSNVLYDKPEKATTPSTTDQYQVEDSEDGTDRQRRSSDEAQAGYGGATYTRWGRSSCPKDPYTEQVYNGSAGSSKYDAVGGVAEFTCLPYDPMWGVFDSGNSGSAPVYGVEYNDNFRGFDKTNLNANSLSNNNVPCAVCRSILRTTAIMIPAWNKCKSGWNLEYHGYLMAGHYSHKSATQYTCIDEAPEADPGGWKSEDSKYLYRVEPVCGALPCPRYVAGRELTCVVCSK